MIQQEKQEVGSHADVVKAKYTNSCLPEAGVTVMGMDILAAVRTVQIKCYAFLSKPLEDTGLCANKIVNLCGSL